MLSSRLQSGLIVLLQHRQSLGDFGLAEFARAVASVGSSILVCRSGEAPLCRDVPPLGLGEFFCDEVVAPPAKWPAVLRQRGMSAVRGIVTNDEYLLGHAQQLSADAGCACMLPSALDHYRDKAVMRRAFETAGLPIPRSISHGDLSGRENSVDAGSSPAQRVIVKPRAEANLRGIYTSVFADLDSPDFDGKVVEEFLDGPQYHCELLIRDGEIRPLLVGRYVRPLLDLASGGISGSVEIRGTQRERVRDLATRACEALGTDGHFVVHAEFLSRSEDPGDIVLGEVCARAPGGEIPFQSRMIAGIDLESVNLCLQARLEPEAWPVSSAASAVWLWSSRAIEVGTAPADGERDDGVVTEVGHVLIGLRVLLTGDDYDSVGHATERIAADHRP